MSYRTSSKTFRQNYSKESRVRLPIQLSLDCLDCIFQLKAAKRPNYFWGQYLPEARASLHKFLCFPGLKRLHHLTPGNSDFEILFKVPSNPLMPDCSEFMEIHLKSGDTGKDYQSFGFQKPTDHNNRTFRFRHKKS